jgi:hypothetical protein
MEKACCAAGVPGWLSGIKSVGCWWLLLVVVALDKGNRRGGEPRHHILLDSLYAVKQAEVKALDRHGGQFDALSQAARANSRQALHMCGVGAVCTGPPTKHQAGSQEIRLSSC